MPFTGTIQNTTARNNGQPSTPQGANGGTQPATDTNRLEMHHIQNIIRNDHVSIQVSAAGWIVLTAVSLARFMGKVTGSAVNVGFLP